jgi:hypothetical protein
MRRRATTPCSSRSANVEIEFGNTILPSFETLVGHDENSYLRELAPWAKQVR